MLSACGGGAAPQAIMTGAMTVDGDDAGKDEGS